MYILLHNDQLHYENVFPSIDDIYLFLEREIQDGCFGDTDLTVSFSEMEDYGVKFQFVNIKDQNDKTLYLYDVKELTLITM